MAKFCGKCGSKLDDITGLCPQCSRGSNAPISSNANTNYINKGTLTEKDKKRREKQEKLAAMTFGQKAKRFLLQMCIWLVAWILLGAIIAGGLVYLDVVDIPIVEDIIDEVEVILHKEHKWLNATCVEPQICKICDETEGAPLGHSWISTSCVDAEVCSVCGETGKEATGHDWIAATCVDAEVCSVCGEIGKEAIGHDWIAATCTDPKMCLTCQETDGSAAGHAWIEASYEAPKTCQICGETDGEPLKPDPVYLVDMDFSDKYGKLWTWSEYVLDYYTHSNPEDTSVYMDMNTPGHTSGKVYDHLGNRYTNGLCVDLGGPASTYYISYDLGGIYTSFTGVCSLIEGMKGTPYTKYFEIYCDGKLVFTSNTMKKGASAQPFSIDVTGVQVLRIQYPPTKGQNRIATLFDGKLS